MLKLTKKQVNAVITAASTVLTRKVEDEIKNVLFVPNGKDHLEAMATNQSETVGLRVDASLDEEIVVPLNALTSYKLAKPDDDFYAYFDGNCVYCGPESDMAEYPAAESDACKPTGLAFTDFDIKAFLSSVREISWGAPKKDAVLYFSDQSVYTQDGSIMAWSYVDGLPDGIPFGSIPLTQVLLKKMPLRGEGKIGYLPRGAITKSDMGEDGCLRVSVEGSPFESVLYLQAGKFWYSVEYTHEAKTDILDALQCVCEYQNAVSFSDPQKQAKELREILEAFPSGFSDHVAVCASVESCVLSVKLEGEILDLPFDVSGSALGEITTVPVISLTHLVSVLDAGFAEFCFGDDPSDPIVFEDGDRACIILPIDPAAYTPEDEILCHGGF